MKSLFFICHLLVLHGIAVRLIRGYVYVPQFMNWTDAQAYCRNNYKDLATITTDVENQNAVKASGRYWTWIGLNRTAPHVNNWQWSDGQQSTFTKWRSGEPNDWPGNNESCTVMDPYGWLDENCQRKYTFICSTRLTLVKENKTWEEAFEYCRTHYTDLAFVNYQTPLDQFKIGTGKAQTTSVWTGLRFLDGKWFWVNGMPLGSLVSLPSCPVRSYRCGAYNLTTNVWENRDCNEQFNFLCY